MNINSEKFNPRQAFLHLLQTSSLDDLVAKANELYHDQSKIDSELQTFVYANYTKFMDATDLSGDINASLSSAEMDSDLDTFQSCLKSINSTHKAIDSGLKLKLKRIQQLDTLSQDLEKLRHLSELPDMLKGALDSYQANSGATIEATFGEYLQLYADYSEILVAYSKTKFMQELYKDIRAQIQRVKAILSQELDKIKAASPELSEIQDSSPAMFVVSKDQQKTIKDTLKYLLLITRTQFPKAEDQATRAQMITSFFQAYKKIKVSQLEELVSTLRPPSSVEVVEANCHFLCHLNQSFVSELIFECSELFQGISSTSFYEDITSCINELAITSIKACLSMENSHETISHCLAQLQRSASCLQTLKNAQENTGDDLFTGAFLKQIYAPVIDASLKGANDKTCLKLASTPLHELMDSPEDIGNRILNLLVESLKPCIFVIPEQEEEITLKLHRLYLNSFRHLCSTALAIVLEQVRSVDFGPQKGSSAEWKKYLGVLVPLQDEKGKVLLSLMRTLRETDIQSLFIELTRRIGLEDTSSSPELTDIYLQFIENYLLTTMKEQLDDAALTLRREFIGHYEFIISSQFSLYITDLKTKAKRMKAGGSDEPASISPMITAISQIIHNEILPDLGVSFTSEKAKVVSEFDSFLAFVQRAHKPELLTTEAKFIQREMEMDKFLAKKSQVYHKQIFQNHMIAHPSRCPPLTFGSPQEPTEILTFQGESSLDANMQFQIYKAIIHSGLKSLFELVRGALRVPSAKMENQLQADLYFLYSSVVYLIFYLFTAQATKRSSTLDEFSDQVHMHFKEELGTLCGLFNEVVCSARQRTLPQVGQAGGVEESVLLMVCEGPFKKLFK